MKIRESHIVPFQEKQVRFQEYGVSIFTSLSTKSSLKKAIKDGLIKIDHEFASTATFISGGESIVLYENSDGNKKPRLELKLKVIFEDDHLAIINKPAGILVSGNKMKTIVNALAFNLAKSTQVDALGYSHPVHRLDFPTSGLLLIAKTNATVVALNKMFEEKKIVKTYHAVTIGSMKKRGIIEIAIKDKEASTQYEVLETLDSEKYGNLNLVKLLPTTGRRHQLRIHMSQIGNPIFGDQTYGVKGFMMTGKGLYLHASSLHFLHPVTNRQVSVDMELPLKFYKIFSKY